MRVRADRSVDAWLWNARSDVDWGIDVDPEAEHMPDAQIAIYGSDMWRKLAKKEIENLPASPSRTARDGTGKIRSWGFGKQIRGCVPKRRQVSRDGVQMMSISMPKYACARMSRNPAILRQGIGL